MDEWIFERSLATYAAVARVWNGACGPEFHVTEDFIAYNLSPTPGLAQVGRFVSQDNVPVGVVIASALMDAPPEIPAHLGWIDAIAVIPAAQGQGIGTALLAWAEDGLRARGCRHVDMGGSFRAFVPGPPASLGTRAYFERRGYTFDHATWDVVRDLGVGPALDRYPPVERGRIRPAETADIPALREFLGRAFPGRWRYEVEVFLGEGGDPADIVILELENRVEGFCWVTGEDSHRPLDRYYLHHYPRPWGQLGPIGVSETCRGHGWGGRLLQAGLVYLRERGTRGCVIDWTRLVDFYGKFGFEPYHRYERLGRILT